MNCLDCTLAGTTTPAVATCHSCGAAVCADHAVIQPHYLQRVVPLNRLIPVEPARSRHRLRSLRRRAGRRPTPRTGTPWSLPPSSRPRP